MRAFRTLLGGSDMLAYLAMMAPRLIELRRVLKPTGSIYLHCDPTASHYLKLLLDSVLGPQMFRNEIVWKRTSSHNDASQGLTRFGKSHDSIFFYSRSEKVTWNLQFRAYDESYLAQHYSNKVSDTGRRFKTSDLTAAKPGGDTSYEWKGVLPSKGRYWAYSKANMEQFEAEDRLVYAAKSGMPRLKHFLDEMPGVTLADLWNDIPPINSQAQERLGYPTQKPEALLERILRASSNEGDVVLDPFCGCGTTVQVAQKLNRRWIGIDITHLAIGLIKTRLTDTFGDGIKATYMVIGEPTDMGGAQQLALENKYQFQYWALGKVDAQPAEQIKKGADRGIDGRKYFHDDRSGKSKQIIFSVKGGKNVGVAEVRDLMGVLQREQAEIGVYISFEEATKPMQREAAEAGFYSSPAGGKYPRLQLLSIKDLLNDGKQVAYPRLLDATFKKAPKHRPAAATNLSLALGGAAEDED